MRGVIQQLESPNHSLPDSVTCGGCHVASPLRHYLDQHRSEAWPTDVFADTHPTDELVAGQFGGTDCIGEAFRMFSYWLGEPVISRRVVRETGLVLDAVHAR